MKSSFDKQDYQQDGGIEQAAQEGPHLSCHVASLGSQHSSSFIIEPCNETLHVFPSTDQDPLSNMRDLQFKKVSAPRSFIWKD